MVSRAVHIEGRAIPYTVGKFNIVIQINFKRKHVASLTDVMEMSWRDIERAKDKGYFEVKPSDVKAYIMREGLDAAIH